MRFFPHKRGPKELLSFCAYRWHPGWPWPSRGCVYVTSCPRLDDSAQAITTNMPSRANHPWNKGDFTIGEHFIIFWRNEAQEAALQTWQEIPSEVRRHAIVLSSAFFSLHDTCLRECVACWNSIQTAASWYSTIYSKATQMRVVACPTTACNPWQLRSLRRLTTSTTNSGTCYPLASKKRKPPGWIWLDGSRARTGNAPLGENSRFDFLAWNKGRPCLKRDKALFEIGITKRVWNRDKPTCLT